MSLILQHNANGILNKKHLLLSGNGVVVVQFMHYINENLLVFTKAVFSKEFQNAKNTWTENEMDMSSSIMNKGS